MRRLNILLLSSRGSVATKSLSRMGRSAQAGRVVTLPRHDFFMGFQIGNTLNRGHSRKGNSVVQIYDPGDKIIEGFWWKLSSWGYARRAGPWNNGKPTRICAHKAIMEDILGRKLTKGELVDHINGNKLDNRRSNLRLTNKVGNGQNRHDLGEFRGTCWSKCNMAWRAYATIRGKQHHAGLFQDRKDAVIAATAKRKELGYLTSNSTP